MIRLDKVEKISNRKQRIIGIELSGFKIRRKLFCGYCRSVRCGKSTLLNVAGYDDIDYGSYYFRDENVNKFSEEKKLELIKSIGVIFKILIYWII